VSALFDGKWIEIFRAGDYGPKGSYSERDLDQLAADYSPSTHEAPLVIGHPQTNAPAYGWVEMLKRTGSTLLAKFRQVVPALEESIKAGRFKKRSISIARSPGVKLQLHHVGFLGAQPPEVKGLADVALDLTSGESIAFREAESADLSAHGVSSSGVTVDPTSIFFSRAAEQLACEEEISFGDALTRIYGTFDWPRMCCLAAMELSHRDGTTFSDAVLRLTREGPIAFGADLSGSVEFAESMQDAPSMVWQAIALARSQQLMARERIGFAEAMKRCFQVDGRGAEIDPRSVVIAVQAYKCAREECISYGEALRKIYAEKEALC
jgi:hypothetical protein